MTGRFKINRQCDETIDNILEKSVSCARYHSLC